jgi:hypothetical protein
MTLSHIGPDPKLPTAGKAFFWVFWIAGMVLFAVYVLPFIAEYASEPFSKWVGSFFD